MSGATRCARDFVDQLDKLMPGEGTKAIRGILQSLADIPGLQRAFFGGPVIETAPIGVFEHDGPRRFDEAMKTKPWEEAEQGRKIPGGDPGVRDMAYRPERDGPLEEPGPPEVARPMTPEEEARRIQPLSDGADANTPPTPTDLLDPHNWPEAYRTQVLAAKDEPLEAEASAKDKEDQDAQAIQIAQAQGQQQPVRVEWQVPSAGFRTAIAVAEGGGARESPWDAVHPNSGASGRYQLTHEALIDAKLKSSRAPDGWVPGNPLGIRTDSELRGNQKAQEAAFDAVMRRNHDQLVQNGAFGTLNQSVKGRVGEFQITQSGLLAAAHRQGAGAVAGYLDRMREHGWNSNDAVRGMSERDLKRHNAIETRLRTCANVR